MDTGLYRHYKGGYYIVDGVGKHTETEEDMVIYRGEDGRRWIRPKSMFEEEVTYTETGTGDTQRGPRFELLLKIRTHGIPCEYYIEKYEKRQQEKNESDQNEQSTTC